MYATIRIAMTSIVMYTASSSHGHSTVDTGPDRHTHDTHTTRHDGSIESLIIDIVPKNTKLYKNVTGKVRTLSEDRLG